MPTRLSGHLCLGRYNHPSSRRTWLSSLSAVLPWFEIPKVWARPMSRFGPLTPPRSRLRFSASSVLYKSNPIQKLTRKISATIISFSSTVNPTPASLSSLLSVDSNDDGYCLAKQLFMLGLAQHNCFRTSKKLSTIEFKFSRFSNPVSSTSWQRFEMLNLYAITQTIISCCIDDQYILGFRSRFDSILLVWICAQRDLFPFEQTVFGIKFGKNLLLYGTSIVKLYAIGFCRASYV